MKKIEMVLILFTMICFVDPFLCAQGNEPSGKVVISFTVERMFTIASDQIAVRIEDEKGSFVRTIFVSNFLGKREGWKLRPQTTPMWQEHSNAKNIPPERNRCSQPSHSI